MEGSVRGEVILPVEDASPGELDILGALDLLGEETSFGELEAEVTGVLEAGAVNEAKAAAAASGGEKVGAGAGDKAMAWKKKTRAVLLSGEDFKSFMACAPTRRERRFIPDELMSKGEAELRKKVAATAKEVDDFFARLREQYDRKGYALFGVEEYDY